MERNINSDRHSKPPGVIHPMVNGGDRKMMPPTLVPGQGVKALEDLLREYELKTAGPKTPKGSLVADGIASKGPMLTESASKEATAKEPSLMESLIDLSAAIQEGERLTAGLKQSSTSKEATAQEPSLMESLVDLSAAIQEDKRLTAGLEQPSPSKYPTSEGPSLKAMDLLIDLNAEEIVPESNQLPPTKMPMDLLVELSAEEKGKTMHSVICDQS